MDFDQWDPNAEVICPYDPLHVVSVKRFQRHLIKCRKVGENLILQFTSLLTWQFGVL